MTEKTTETKNQLMRKKLEGKVSNQNYCHGMEKDFEPSIQQQNEITKALSTEKEDLGKTFHQGVENYNQRHRKNNETLSNLIKSIAIDSSITTTLANLLNSSNESQYGLTNLNGNRFSINKLNPQNDIIKRSILTFDHGNRCDLNN